MEIYTSGKNKQIDSYAINTLGIPGTELMHNAAEKIAETVKNNVQPLSRICIVCGNGNNGGDGFALAPILLGLGYDVSVLCCNDKELTPDARYYFERLGGVPVYRFTDNRFFALMRIMESDAVVDAMYGNGFRGALNEDCAQIAEVINTSPAFVVAVDIPSGCNCNSGSVDGVAVMADVTVALSTLKPCYYIYPACEHCGKVELKDIGIPYKAYNAFKRDAVVYGEEECAYFLKKRPVDSHKGTFGRLLLYCGSEDMPGAARLALGGALRSGVGLTELAALKSVCDKAALKFDEPIYRPFDDTEELCEQLPVIAQGCDAAVIGCGIGRDEYAAVAVKNILTETDMRVILDADGINALEGNINILKGRKGECIITPHPKELSRLMGLTVGEIQNDRMGCALQAAQQLGVVTVLKGAHTVIATPEGEVFINITGNSGLAKGGSGDVLSGLIGSFLAQGYKARYAALLGVYVHGKAADICAGELGEETMLPSDLPLYFSKVFKGLKK